MTDDRIPIRLTTDPVSYAIGSGPTVRSKTLAATLALIGRVATQGRRVKIEALSLFPYGTQQDLLTNRLYKFRQLDNKIEEQFGIRLVAAIDSNDRVTLTPEARRRFAWFIDGARMVPRAALKTPRGFAPLNADQVRLCVELPRINASVVMGHHTPARRDLVAFKEWRRQRQAAGALGPFWNALGASLAHLMWAQLEAEAGNLLKMHDQLAEIEPWFRAVGRGNRDLATALRQRVDLLSLEGRVRQGDLELGGLSDVELSGDVPSEIHRLRQHEVRAGRARRRAELLGDAREAMAAVASYQEAIAWSLQGLRLLDTARLLSKLGVALTNLHRLIGEPGSKARGWTMSPSDTAERAVVATCAAMAAQWSIGSRVKAKNKERLINATHAVAMFLRAVRVTRLDKPVVLRIVRSWDVLPGATLDSGDALMEKLDEWIDKVWLTRKSSLGTLLAVIEALRQCGEEDSLLRRKALARVDKALRGIDHSEAHASARAAGLVRPGPKRGQTRRSRTPASP